MRFNAQSVPDLAPLTVFGKYQVQKNPHMSYSSLGTCTVGWQEQATTATVFQEL